MVDEYIQGDVRKLSPESAVPLLTRSNESTIESDLIRLGGAGNTARNLASYGAHVTLIGIYGNDQLASSKLELLGAAHNESVDPDKSTVRSRLAIKCYFIQQEGMRTTHKLRMINRQSSQLFRVDTESDQQASQETIRKLYEVIEHESNYCDVAVITDYAKGLVNIETFQKIRQLLAKKPIIVDPKERNAGEGFSKYIGADVIVPNEAELKRSMGFDGDLNDYFHGEIQRRLSDLNIKSIICTRGASGITWSTADMDSPVTEKGKPVEVADVTGASDTVTATVALTIASLGSQVTNNVLGIAATLGEAAGRIKVTKRLTGTVECMELIDGVDPKFRIKAASKLIKETNLFIDRCNSLRQLGGSRVVSLVTGCFDILHAGHVLLLEYAAEISDIVVVAVNSDSYIRRCKPSKIDGPYLDELSRATMVASLSSVSIVTIFDEDTPEDIIQSIRPDVLVMGEEYQRLYDDASLPGYQFIKMNDIQVVCKGFEQTRGLSSSLIASRMKRISNEG